LPFMGQPWPSSWIEVERELLARPEHYISTDTYIDLCMTKGIRAALAHGTLGNYLHDLGKVLYFRDDPALSDIVILKPNWVAKAISLVLEDKGIRDRSGILVDTDLSRIWAVDEQGQPYDPALHPLFLRLMERFDLCYQIDSQLLGEYETYYFIPQLLPSHPPSSLPSWTTKEMKAGKVHVEIIYHLDFVPTGIMNWFIVRTHQYTCSMHWREGVVLSYQDHLARIEMFAKRKELHMEVWGPEPHAFFVVLKKTMDLILSRFEGLHVRQEVPCICHRQTGETRPCPEVYRYEQDLIKRLNQNVETIQCRESFCNIAVRELLYGHHMSTASQAQQAISVEINEIIQQLDAISENQDKLRSEVLAEQKDIIQRLNAITAQQSRKESTHYQLSDVQQYDAPQYKVKSRSNEPPEPSSEPPNLLKQAWDWYKRQQPPKQKKPPSKFKLGCIALIIGFFLCVFLSRMFSGNQSSPTTPNNTLPANAQTR
ncbi:MAG TPA: COR domain-containing protein, partial [Ktedonobacteraceae bacterium]